MHVTRTFPERQPMAGKWIFQGDPLANERRIINAKPRIPQHGRR